MSEVLFGTIIGGSIGITATIIGSIIKGIFDARNTKLQYKFKLEEMQIERIIKIRAEYLNILVSRLQTIIEASQYIKTMANNINQLCITDTIAWADSRTDDSLKNIVKHSGSISTSIEEIHMHQSQITDAKTVNLTCALIDLYEKLTIPISNLVNMQSKCLEGKVIKFSNTDICKECNVIKDIITYMFTTIRQTNKRIEELLSGMD